MWRVKAGRESLVNEVCTGTMLMVASEEFGREVSGTGKGVSDFSRWMSCIGTSLKRRSMGGSFGSSLVGLEFFHGTRGSMWHE
jgi:hypothetical protein